MTASITTRAHLDAAICRHAREWESPDSTVRYGPARRCSMSNVVVLKTAMERVEVDSSCVTAEILRRTFRVSSVVLRILCT